LFIYKYFYIYLEFISQKLLFIGKSTSNVEVVPINVLLQLKSKKFLISDVQLHLSIKVGNMAI
jgi:hypothetical protein